MDHFFKVIEKSKKFISATIESQEKKNLTHLELNINDEILPLEYFMKIPIRMKIHKFYQDIKIGDAVIGSVMRIYQNRLEANLICTTGALIRDIDGLKITAICRANELPLVSNFSSIKAFQCGDRIKAIITKITRNESLEISMNEQSSMNIFHQIDLGLISDDNLPSHYRITKDPSESRHYYNDIFPSNELTTSMDIKNRLEYYNISSSGFSLLNDMNEIKIHEHETAKNMRSALLLKESMKYVVKGVNYYKLKQLNEALQCYNHALSINEANVDALVARGALRASSRSFELSIEDLEKAVKIDPTHKNAALYLSQTIVAYSKSIPEDDRSVAEDFVKTNIISRDDSHNKTVINDIKDPNQFIVITDEDSSNSSKSSKSRRKRKIKKAKKRKSKSSKKFVAADSSSNEDRKHYSKHQVVTIDSSSDSGDYNKSFTYTGGSSNKKRKYSRDIEQSNRCVKRRYLSSSSDNDNGLIKITSEKSDNSKHIQDNIYSRQKSVHTKDLLRSSYPMSWRNISVSSSHKNKSKKNSSSDGSSDSYKYESSERKLPRYLNQSFKDNSYAHTWSSHISNVDHNNSSKDQLKYAETNVHKPSVKEQDRNNGHNSNVPDIIVSCDRENLKLKKANEDIKQIEDFISTLRQSVPL